MHEARRGTRCRGRQSFRRRTDLVRKIDHVYIYTIYIPYIYIPYIYIPYIYIIYTRVRCHRPGDEAIGVPVTVKSLRGLGISVLRDGPACAPLSN